MTGIVIGFVFFDTDLIECSVYASTLFTIWLMEMYQLYYPISLWFVLNQINKSTCLTEIG